MSTPASRLRAAREKRGFATARDAARAYNWPISAYASHENGNRGIPADEAIKYARAFRFSLDWLYKGTTSEPSMGVDSAPNIVFKLIPRLLWNFLDKYGNLETAMSEATEFASLPKTLNLPLPAFSMTVIGDSMRNPSSPDSFKEGDELIFSASSAIKPGDFVLAEIPSENAVVFRQYMERGRTADGFMTFDLAPLNSAYRTFKITAPDQARLVAKMVHALKSYL